MRAFSTQNDMRTTCIIYLPSTFSPHSRPQILDRVLITGAAMGSTLYCQDILEPQWLFATFASNIPVDGDSRIAIGTTVTTARSRSLGIQAGRPAISALLGTIRRHSATIRHRREGNAARRGSKCHWFQSACDRLTSAISASRTAQDLSVESPVELKECCSSNYYRASRGSRLLPK